MSKAFKLGELATREEAQAKLTTPRTRTVAPPSKAAEGEAVTSDPIRPFNVRLPESLTTKLGEARLRDKIPAVTRIRALIEIWTEDEELQARVADAARRIAAADKARRQEN